MLGLGLGFLRYIAFWLTILVDVWLSVAWLFVLLFSVFYFTGFELMKFNFHIFKLQYPLNRLILLKFLKYLFQTLTNHTLVKSFETTMNILYN
jgi:hypothetical protein